MFKKIFNLKNIIWLVFYLFVFILLIGNSYKYLDVDLGWHLKVGEDILAHHSLPQIDNYSYPMAGKTWIDHEWLSNIIIFLLFKYFGYFGLSLFFVFIIILSLVILNKIVFKYFTEEDARVQFFLIIFEIIGLMGCLPHFGIRIQELTILFLSILYLIIYQYNKTKKFYFLFFLPLLFWFWASLHGGFLIGIFILFLYIGIKILEKIIYRYKPLAIFDFSQLLTNKKIIIFTIFSLLAILATCLTLYNIKIYQFLFTYKNTYYLTHIQEWLPIYYAPLDYWKYAYIIIVTIFIFLTLWLVLDKKNGRKVNLWEIATILFFLIISVKSIRNFPLLLFSTLPFITIFYSCYLSPPKNFFNKKFKLVTSLFLILFLSMLGLYYFKKIRIVNDSFQGYCQKFPCGAVDFLAKNEYLQKQKIFNEYSWGGYLLWRLPEMKNFIDGRAPQANYKNHTLLEEANEFHMEDELEKKLQEYKIELVIIAARYPQIKLDWIEKYIFYANEDLINKKENYLRSYLEKSQNWKIIYRDNVSLIFLKK